MVDERLGWSDSKEEKTRYLIRGEEKEERCQVKNF